METEPLACASDPRTRLLLRTLLSAFLGPTLLATAPLSGTFAVQQSPAYPTFDAPRGESLAWIENLGQWPGEARFVARLGAVLARVEPTALALQLCTTPNSGALVRFAFVDPNPAVRIEPVGLRPGVHSYFLGNDPASWFAGARAWSAIVYRDLWPGIDLSLDVQDGVFKYDVVVKPGADLARVQFEVVGHTDLRIDSGALVATTSVGLLSQPTPLSFELDATGARRTFDVQYQLLDPHRVGFRAIGREPTSTLVIDPGLIWASYIGSSNFGMVGDSAYAVAVRKNDEAVVAGTTDWGNFPVTPGTYSTPFRKDRKAFVSVFDSTGTSLVYSCLLGGNSPVGINGYTQALAVDAGSNGDVVVAGWTSHPDYPVTSGALDTVLDGPGIGTRSGFVTKLDRTGTKLVYSTFLEGSGDGDEVHCVRLDESGAALLGGQAASTDFPVTPGAFDTIHGPSTPGFLCRLNPTGTALEWSTFLGTGSSVRSLDWESSGAILIAGMTGAGFPATPTAFDKSHNGQGWDCFAAKLTGDGKTLVWGTYLGGQGDDTFPHVAVHESGDVIVAGRTMSQDFPITPGVFQTQHTPAAINNFDTFVTRVSKDGSSLVYSTFIGGIGRDEVAGVGVDTAGVVTIGGTGAGTYPITKGAQDADQVLYEGTLTRLSPDAKRLFYSSYVGGTGHDELHAVSVDESGIVTAAGFTTGGFPVTPGAFGTTYFGGQTDAVVCRVELQPIGVLPYGSSTPNCHGPFLIGVTEQPAAGSNTFSLYASGAPENAIGLLGLSPLGNPWGRDVLGLTLWLGPSPGMAVLPVQAQSIPYAEVVIPIPLAAAGLEVYAQFAFQNTPTCGGSGTYSATNALKLTIQ
jgi:hypothetical protein